MELLTERDVLARLGASVGALHDRINRGDFPPPLVYGSSGRFWHPGEVDIALKARTTQSRPEKPKRPETRERKQPGAVKRPAE